MSESKTAESKSAKSDVIYWITDDQSYNRKSRGSDFTLPADEKRAWIKALRSNKYTQLHGALARVIPNKNEALHAYGPRLGNNGMSNVYGEAGSFKLDELRADHVISACCLGVFACENAVGRIGDKSDSRIVMEVEGTLNFNWWMPDNSGNEQGMLPLTTVKRWGWPQDCNNGPLNKVVRFIKISIFQAWQESVKSQKVAYERMYPGETPPKATLAEYKRRHDVKSADSLVTLNDNGFTFAQIANIIDKQYPGV